MLNSHLCDSVLSLSYHQIIEWLCDNVSAFEAFDQIQEFILGRWQLKHGDTNLTISSSQSSASLFLFLLLLFSCLLSFVVHLVYAKPTFFTSSVWLLRPTYPPCASEELENRFSLFGSLETRAHDGLPLEKVLML